VAHHGGGGISSVCGNEKIEYIEQCDDGNRDNGDGCDEYCKVEDNWECSGSPSVCTQKPYCGDGECSAGETCAGCPEDCGECTTEETTTTTTTVPEEMPKTPTGAFLTSPTGMFLTSPGGIGSILVLASLLSLLYFWKKRRRE